MDIKTVSEEEKRDHIDKIKGFFYILRKTLNTLEIDIESEDLTTQASAIWISGNLCEWFNDFTKQVKEIHTQKDEIQKQMAEMQN